MKFSRLFKKNVCHAILLGFTSQLFGTFALVAHQPTPHKVQQQTNPEYIETQENSLDIMIMDLVQKAASCDTECAPSEALMRCYQRVTNGYKTLLVADVMQAMPELLAYAFAKYDESITNRSSRPTDTEWQNVKVPKQSNATVSEAPASLENEDMHKNITERDLVQLLLIIKKRIGTIHDSDCANSILGILGNACEVFGSNSNLSLKIKEILTKTDANVASLSNAISSCCNEILSTMDADFEHTWSLIAGINTAALAHSQLASDQVNQRFDVLEQLITNANANQQPQSGSSKNVIKTILEQTDVLSSKFEKTWDFMDEQNQLAKSETDYLVTKLQEQTEEIKHIIEERPLTLELNIEELQEKNITIACDQKEIKNAIKKSSAELAEDISDTKKIVHEGFKDQTALINHKFHKQAEYIEDQAKILHHKLYEQDQFIADKLEHESNYIHHKFHEQAKLIEEQTEKILHGSHGAHESHSRISPEFIEKQTDYLAHKLHEQDKFIADKFKDETKLLLHKLENESNYIHHKFNEQAKLIEEQTKKILHHAPHEPSHSSHISHEFIEKQTDYLAHKLHEQDKFMEKLIEEQTKKLIKHAAHSSGTPHSSETSHSSPISHEFLDHKFHKQGKLIEDQTKEIKHLIHKQPHILLDEIKHIINKQPVTLVCDIKELQEKVTFVCDQHELKESLKKCCDDLADDIFETQKLISGEFKDQARFIEEQAKEIKHKINRQTDIFTDEINDVIATVTECCESLHDELEDLFEEQTKELIHKINKRTDSIVCGISDLKATLTECCDDLADDIFCTQKLIKCEFKDQACFIEEQTKEIKHKINRQTDILTDEINEVIATVTECCESLHDEMQDQTEELIHKINKRTDSIICNIADLRATVTECCDDLADDIFCTQKLICKGFEEQSCFIEEQTKEIKHKINRQTDILTDEINEVIATVTECCESLHDEMQDLNDELTNELKEKMRKQTNIIVCNIMDLKETLTECCDDLADDIFCTQKLICKGFEEQAALINHKFHKTDELLEVIDCKLGKSKICKSHKPFGQVLPALDVIHDEQFEQTDEIKHKINRQTDILTDEINDLTETITECCESLHDGLCDVAQMLDDITDAVLCTEKLICKGFKEQANLIEEQTKEIKHKINRQTDIITDEIADVISTVTECCESLHDEICDTQELICKGFKELDCILTLQTELLACNITELDDLNKTIVECCDDLADDIFDTQTLIIACCKQTQSLIEECCEETHSLIIDCCIETQSLIEECCEQTQSNFEHTWSLIEECCDGTHSLIEQCCKETQSLIEECCEQTQSNFEYTWSLIEECCDVTHSIIEQCCKETQSLIEECCEQTQSNFEHTWSLIENLEVTVSVDFTEVLTTLSACCQQTQSNFVHTWSLIEECCEGTHSLIEQCCKVTQSLVEECCELTTSNFEHTWSLIEECCEELHEQLETTQSTLIECCLQTQSNFEQTWSLINNVEHTLTQCCEQTQSNFQTTFSLIKDLKETVTECCVAVTDALGSGTDQIVSFSCTETSINNLDVSAISLLKTLLYQNCSTAPQWVLTVDEPLDSAASLSQFTQTDGVWTQVGDHVNTAATSPSNFLQYNFPIQETYEVLEVDIELPSGVQPASQGSCAAGLLSNWNGSNSSTGGPSVAFFNFATDGAGNITGTPKFVVETFFGGLHTEVNFPSLAYDTVYNVRLERIPLQQTTTYITVVYINGVLTLISPASGSVPGDFIGLWAFEATANFKNFKSWSAAALPLLVLPPL